MDENLLVYNGMDCVATLEIFEEFKSEVMNDVCFKQTYDFTMRLVEPLLFMMNHGIKVDAAALRKASGETQEKINEREAKLNELCGRVLNPLSSKDCAKYFYLEKGVPPYTKMNNKGDSVVTCDDNALTRLARGTKSRKGLYEAKLIQEIRGLRKLKSTYLDIRIDPDGRFRFFCNPRGTRMGRISTQKTFEGTGTNAQNLTENFKQFLLPDDGHLMISFDKRQAEWVVVAYQSGDANMIRVVEQGLDAHAATASMMYGMPIEVILREDELLGHESDPVVIAEARREIEELRDKKLPRTMSMRQAGKKANHGLNYDEGAYTFALFNEIPEWEADDIIKKYHAIYPGIRNNHSAIQSLLRKDRCLVNCFGRKYQFLDDWGPILFKSAYSFVPQSTVPDLLNRGIIDIYETDDKYLQFGELLAQVHDEALYQFPIDLGPQTLAYVIRTIAEDIFNPVMEYGGRQFQIPTDVKVSTKNWRDMHKLNLSMPSDLLGQNSLEDQLARVLRE